jgi:FixJ family two-component response regulator
MARIAYKGHLFDTECLIVDVKMPEMSNLELQDELFRRAIRIPAIFMSAYASPAVTNRVKSGEAVCFVEKPFEAEAIEACLNKAFKGAHRSE